MDRRDDLIAKVGDLWITEYSGILVSVIKTDKDHITYLRMNPDSKQERRKRLKSDFYSVFRRINEDDLNGKAEYDYKKFLS